MHNNGNFKELARDQDQVVVAKTKHAALLFSLKPKASHITLAFFFSFQKETGNLKKCRERTLFSSHTHHLGLIQFSLLKLNATEPI